MVLGKLPAGKLLPILTLTQTVTLYKYTKKNRNTPKTMLFSFGPTNNIKIQKRLKTLILKKLQVLIKYRPD